MATQVAVFRRNHPTERLSMHPAFYNADVGPLEEDDLPSSAARHRPRRLAGPPVRRAPGLHPHRHRRGRRGRGRGDRRCARPRHRHRQPRPGAAAPVPGRRCARRSWPAAGGSCRSSSCSTTCPAMRAPLAPSAGRPTPAGRPRAPDMTDTVSRRPRRRPPRPRPNQPPPAGARPAWPARASPGRPSRSSPRRSSLVPWARAAGGRSRCSASTTSCRPTCATRACRARSGSRPRRATRRYPALLGATRRFGLFLLPDLGGGRAGRRAVAAGRPAHERAGGRVRARWRSRRWPTRSSSRAATSSWPVATS